MKINNYGTWIIESGRLRMRQFNFKLVARLTGVLLCVMAAFMVLPLLVSVVYKDGALFDLLISDIVILLSGLILRNIVGRNCEYELHEKESFWITSVVWIVIPLLGGLPYLMTGVTHSFTDAVFESFSGFTTTGSSLLSDLDHAPAGILMWRSVTQWIGGLGLLLFIVAVLRKLNVGSQQLYDAEFSGTVQRKLHPKISTSVRLMWIIYLGMTLVLCGLLCLCGNSFLDSFCTATSAVSTGGFMVHDAGVVGMSQLSLVFITIFMFFSGVNIALLYRLFTGHGMELWRSEEFRVYLGSFIFAFLISSVAFVCKGNSLTQSVCFSVFHVASTVSTCGINIPQPAVWPFAVSGVTFALILFGAMSGSTGGALKLKRIMILYKYVRNYFTRMLHPRAVFCVKIDNIRISDEYINKIFAFVFLYIMFIVGGAFVLTFCGMDIPTSVCVAAANIANLGPSPLINVMGAEFDYLSLIPVAKWTLIVLMLVGRVEIFSIIAIFSPVYWRR